MNKNIVSNYSKLKAPLFLFPIFLLIIIVLFLHRNDALSVNGYVQIQKDNFLFINHHLAQYPNLQLNLTQLGDALILLSFLSIFIVYAPKIWEAVISGLLVSVLFSSSLKSMFGIPRPGELLDNNSFTIIGRKMSGFSSCPSGHSITIFTVLTVLLFAFMPQKLKHKIIWSLFIVITGLILAFTRVGVGAHYPIDVITGSIIGYISGLAGIFISREYRAWAWSSNKKYYLFFIVLFLICSVILVTRIVNERLVIFYLSLTSLVISLYKTISVYAKNIKK
ncbi:MAG: phosphatase PAP2 family protein [Chitinophagaceae bacterium]|nr:phosphatase PAP2 family protein [Chitinophagaceae bacterium]